MLLKLVCVHSQKFASLSGRYFFGWPAGRLNMIIRLISAQLGLAGAWAELGNNGDKTWVFSVKLY